MQILHNIAFSGNQICVVQGNLDNVCLLEGGKELEKNIDGSITIKKLILE